MAKTRRKTKKLTIPRRRSGIKLYEQIKSTIRSRVADGDWPPGHRLPTLKELSEQADVSYATVERAVRELVDEGLLIGRKRGGTTVAEHRRARNGAIGIVGDTPYGVLFTKSRYFSTLLMMLQECIIEQKRMVVYDHRHDDVPMTEMFRNLSLVDAVIAFGSSKQMEDELTRTQRMGIPVITVGDAHPHIPSVASDSEGDMYAAVRVLQQWGHERIAYVIHKFGADGPTSMLRRQGYRNAMEQSEAGYDPSMVIICDIEEQAERLLAIDLPPTALVYPQSRHFADVDAGLRDTHLDPRKSLMVCTYDENLWNTITPLQIEFLSVEQRLRLIARDALDMITRMIKSPGTPVASMQTSSLLVHVNKDGVRRILREGEESA